MSDFWTRSSFVPFSSLSALTPLVSSCSSEVLKFECWGAWWLIQQSTWPLILGPWVWAPCWAQRLLNKKKNLLYNDSNHNYCRELLQEFSEPLHIVLLELCLAHKKHSVSTSYLHWWWWWYCDDNSSNTAMSLPLRWVRPWGACWLKKKSPSLGQVGMKYQWKLREIQFKRSSGPFSLDADKLLKASYIEKKNKNQRKVISAWPS